MKLSTSERHQIENEMIFRRANEKIGHDLDLLNATNLAEGDADLVHNDDMLLDFICECSDETCKGRIKMRLSTYRKIHEDRDSFIVKLKHQVKEIEKVVLTEANYAVVKKNNSTPEPGDMLNITKIRNKK
jgi:hypothetical protein